jgi:uncharacterized protein DUF2865
MSLKSRTVILVTVLSSAAITSSLNTASAAGFLDFLFGGFQQRSAPPPAPDAYPPPPPEIGRVAPAPLGPESVTGDGAGTGHSVTFCVRLCDGRQFPMEHMVSGTPVETCRAICPYSKTKVFFGSEIDSAIAQDGQRYSNLDTAFVYRKQLVANCTCNGKDAFGLTALDVKNDPTLRPGDIVSTKDGFLAYTGRSAQGAVFTRVNPATLPVDIGSAPLRSPPITEPGVEEDPGTVVQRTQQPAQAPNVPASANNPAR